MSIYDFSAKSITGKEVSLSEYKGKVLLIVNTASKCGFTPQYKDLEAIYKKLGNDKFEILGFPCNQFAKQEPGTSDDIKNFCEINYGVTFPLFEKVDVKGPTAHEVFKYLTTEKPGILGGEIKWNFTKFLIDKNGNVVDRFAPTTSPTKIEKDIIKLMEV
ncbi:glutathione peroxidase [Clostridium sp. 'White wine YQ']|uniref:glutathione peroxidase n=1 Tax=Clostridium sp. 'White wine YQ' TaxID=3027474 RepID=UPI002366786A|nr:glutathione peroxidase [Clostridium sp. 'White wine YQ']MDD7796194.1 glutathione peroxidase [Clostridium sp. 'White wine YQ']